MEVEWSSISEAAPNVLKEACTFTSNLMPTTAASPAFSPPSSGTEGRTPALSGTVPTAVPPVLMAAVSMSILASRLHSSGSNKMNKESKELPAVCRTKGTHGKVSIRASVYKWAIPGSITGSPAAVSGAPPISGCSPSFLPNEGLPITNTSLSLGTLPEESNKTGYCVEESSSITLET